MALRAPVPHFRVEERFGDLAPQVRLSDLHRTAIQSGVPVFFLNPMENQLATPFCLRRVEGDSRRWETVPTDDDLVADFAIEALDDRCDLDRRRGLVTPKFLEVWSQMSDYLRVQSEADALLEQLRAAQQSKLARANVGDALGSVRVRPMVRATAPSGREAERVYSERSPAEDAASVPDLRSVGEVVRGCRGSVRRSWSRRMAWGRRSRL